MPDFGVKECVHTSARLSIGTVERHHLPRMKAHLKKEGTEKVLREEEESADELKHPWANSNCSLLTHRLTDRSRQKWLEPHVV